MMSTGTASTAATTPPPAPSTTSPSATIEITEAAAGEIAKQRAKRGTPEAAIRVGIRGGGCTGFGYLFEWCDDEPRPTDRVFEFANPSGGTEPIKVFCDPKSLLYLDGTTLDFVTSVMGHGFKFVNPNVKGTCGCGESVQF